MIGRLFSTKRLLVLIVAGLLVTSLLPPAPARLIGDWPRDRVQDALHRTLLVGALGRFAEVLRPAAAPSTAADRDFAALYEEERVYSAQLRARIAELESRIQLLSGTHVVLPLSGYTRVTARVTDASVAAGERWIVVDVGAGSGVAAGQCVVAGQALVGLVGNVTPLTATVRIAASENAQLRVELVPPEPGPPARRTEALAVYRRDGSRFDVEVGGQHAVEVGDVARLVDPRFPDEAHGFVVGRVTSVAADPADPLMFRLVQIQPAAQATPGQSVIILVPIP